jgi:hypothetical protein
MEINARALTRITNRQTTKTVKYIKFQLNNPEHNYNTIIHVNFLPVMFQNISFSGQYTGDPGPNTKSDVSDRCFEKVLLPPLPPQAPAAPSCPLLPPIPPF